MRYGAVSAAIIVAMSWGMSGCAPDEGDQVSATQSALDTAHMRVVQECSLAVTGSTFTYNPANWPTGTTNATYAYATADQNAWNLLLQHSDNTVNGVLKPAWFASCLYKAGTPAYYQPCSLFSYGSSEVLNYACQGSCIAGLKHGGQAKAFMNLVAYRSLTYRDASFGFKSFPDDLTIASSPVGGPLMPAATTANIVEGDYLRRPFGHAATVVRKLSPAQVVVVDSNWVGGAGAEIVGSHVLSFTGGGGDTDLGAYRVLKCAYAGGC